ncbi:MAG: PKD domain-containing protein [Flavobacteriales bacterium]|nr:PKD domain-containing protein [Flavobacteriales bacterium]
MMRSVITSYLIALLSLVSFGVEAQTVNDGLNPGSAFTSLEEALEVPAAGVYWFDFGGFAFSTFVDANGYVQVAFDQGDGLGALQEMPFLDNNISGVLLDFILLNILDIAEIRISHSGGLLDVSTQNTDLISKLKNNQPLNNGLVDEAFNREWVGVGADAMNRASGVAACLGEATSTLSETIFFPCGDTEGMHWEPSKGIQRLEFSAGEIGNTESFTLWVKAEQSKGCNDNDDDGICDYIDLDDDNDGILDADECPNTLVSKSFETSGGTTTTFLAPSADGGFRFDIFKLDNSFNLNVNGSDVVTNQIQCEGGGASGESLLVFSADNTGFGQGGNDNVWVINGDANEPVVRLIIGPNGEVSFQGKRNSGRGLESMEILSGDPQPINVTWNTSGNNTVVLSQAVKGATNISGEGNGVVLCVTDTDGDGILNSFDSDSDGDGCPDAVEGSADFKLTDVNGDGLLVGAIDANGVPLVGNGGQNVGSSVDENIKSNECGCDDSDNDGVCDDIDLDDDNDGILDVDECMESNFHWSSQPAVSGKTATGTINGVGYTYTSSINIETTPSIFQYETFPSSFDIPNITVIKNRFASENTIVFDTPIQNPTLLFSSIGGGNTVPINFAQPIEVLFESGPLNVISANQISGKEVDLIVRLNGTYESISFDYMADENYVNFTFGADFATFCDTDNDGTPDYLDTDSDNDGCTDAVEGDAGFKLTDVNGNDILAGAIDANGVPVAAAGGQGKGSSDDAAIEALVCAACDVEKPAINGVDGQAFHSFYFDADQLLNETVNGLAAGEKYKVKVTGTWSIWSSDPTKNVLDAAYRYKQKNASADIVPIAGISWQINGASPSRPVPDVYNAEHTYFFEPIATGNGEVFFFSDNNYGDNGGGMNFEFYKILDTIRVCASNTNTLLTEYADGQDLKWYSSETSNDGTVTVPNIDNNVPRLSEYWVTQTINGCESDRIQILYLVKPLPVVELGVDIDLCSGESVILNAGNHASYLWNTTAITSDIEVATTGSYSVEVTNSKGCKATSVIEVTVASCTINYIKTDTLYVCDEDSILINANEVTTEVWGGDEGFTLVNDSTIKVSPTVNSYYFIGDKGGKSIGENLIVNGDFENGNTGFTTEYQEKCTPTQGPGKFCINNNPKNVHGGFSACGDHTSGTGNMYIANGAPVAGQKVWCQTVATETNKEYEFSSWVASVVGQNPPNFEFRVNGVSIGALTANVGSCQWDQYAAIWESGNTTSVEICLTNENTVGSGNDFAVDDISFAPIHYTASGGDSVFVIVSENPVVNLGSDTAICDEETLKINAGNYASYLWNTTETTSNIEVAATKTYSVEVTDSKGCVGRDTLSVVVEQCQERLCGGDINFNTWAQSGLSTDGNWVVSSDGSSVNQTINGVPTFYNGKKDYLNVKFSGKMRTDFTGDDDFMGMVFGYQGDVLSANYPIQLKTYVFGWKQKNQVVFGNDWPEGFSLIEVNKTVNTKQEFYEAFTAPFTGSTVLASDYGLGKGYTTGIDYDVSIEFTSTKIKIYVDNNLIFDVDGCFDSGKIGFYNFSQPDVTYSDFEYQFISDIAVSDDTLCIGEEIELDLTCNQTNFYPDGTIFSWDLDDGTKSNLEEIDHTYQTPGVYDLELIVSDGIGCSDTATQKVYVSAYPIRQLGNDTTICADSLITLDADGKTGNTYLWSTNETTKKITVNNTGEYRVNVVNWADCIIKDTINVTKQGLPIVDLGNDTTICADSTILFTVKTGAVWSWSNGVKTQVTTANSTGEYSVIVEDEIGCTSYDTIHLELQDLPIVDLGNDTTICADSSITFHVKEGVYWNWSNGDKTQKTSGISSNGEYSVVVIDDIGCTSYDTIELAIRTLPLVNLGNDTIICDGESVVLDSKNEGLNYFWNTGETTEEIILKTTGVYGVEVTDDIGCLGSDSMELTVNSMPHVNLGNDTAICIGESVTLNAQNPGFNYLWSNRDNQQSITVFQTSIVSVEVYDEIGCSDQDEISINVHQLPLVSLGNDTVLCKYQSLMLDAENISLNFSWNTLDKSQTITVDEEGGYSVEVTDEIGCLGSDEIYVTKEILPDPYFEKDKIICEGTAITLAPDAGFESYDIYWLSNVASFEIEVTETGAYSSVIQSEFCKDTFVVNVAKIDTPDAVIIDLYGDGVYCFDLESTALRIGSEEPNISYDWIDFGRVEEVEIVAAGEYHVTASNDFCTSNYTQSIQEHCAGRLFIPNSFTPNNDGINDVFKPVSNGHVDDFDFRVYDRWGTLIFQTNNLDEGWDGRLRNNIVMIDVFVYKVSYEYLSENGGFEKEELVGTVTVLK